MQYANDFKEIRDLNLFKPKKKNTCYINETNFEYIMPLWSYNEINKNTKTKTPKTKRLNASSSVQYRRSNFDLYEVAL